MKLMDQWRPVLSGQERALVTDIFTAPLQGDKVVAIGVPVMRGGQATHVLVASLNLRWFDELVTRQGLGGWRRGNLRPQLEIHRAQRRGRGAARDRSVGPADRGHEAQA